MTSRAHIAAALTVLTVAVIAVAAAVIGGGGSAAAIGGTAGRAAPYQAPPVQNLAALQLAPAQANSIFVSVAPCRIVDTRIAGGKLTTDATRNFAVHGTAGFPAQGGNNGGCGIPNSATAITLSIIAVNAAVPGHLDAWATGTTRPTASVLNFQKGQNTNTGATVPIKAGANPALSIHAGSGPLDVVIDVTGYYAPQMHGLVSPASSGDATHNAPIYAGSSRIISATNPSDGVYVVTFDGNITYCTPMVDTYNAGSGVYGAAYAFSANTATVFTWYLSNTTHLEVPFSFYFYVYVVC